MEIFCGKSGIILLLTIQLNLIYAFRLPGNYEIKLTNNNGICNDTMFKNIIVEGVYS